MRAEVLTGTSVAGIDFAQDGNLVQGLPVAQLEGVVVENVVGRFVDDGAAVLLDTTEAHFVDCVIRDNTTRYGGLYVYRSHVDFEGGQVIRTMSLDNQGGAAFIDANAFEATLDVIESDWGTGAALDNAAYDVGCDPGGVNWLGNPANATCSVSDPDCCTPS